VDVIQLVDGHWTPDGDGLIVSDVAGQFHYYRVESKELMAYARYDQFLSSDYRPIRNEGDTVFDAETGIEAHIRTDRCHPLLGFPCREQDVDSAWCAEALSLLPHVTSLEVTGNIVDIV
jgi:hypothetical protein